MLRFLKKTLSKLIGDGKSLRSVLTLLSGTMLAQVVTVVATIPLARLYSPTDFGFFAIAQSIVTVGAALAGLRYDVAIVLPEKDADARVLHKLASRTILGASTLLAVALLLLHRWIGTHYENSAFGLWLTTVAIIVYAMAQIANIQYWLIRTKNFKLIARNRVTASLLMVAFQLVLAPLIGGFEGLLLGMLIGQSLTLVILKLFTKELQEPIPADAPKLGAVAKRYKKMPLLNAPNVAFDSIRNAGINVLIGSIALGGLGQYSLANRAAHAPVYLINGAIAQAFLRQMATTKPGGLVPLVRRLLARIGLVSLPIFIVFYLISPWLFPFLFGGEWAEAGLFAQALVPWLFLNTFTSPLSNVFVTTEKQEWLLGFAFFYAAVPLAFLALTPLPLYETVQVLSWIMTALLVCMLVLSLAVARHFDRTGTAGGVG